MMNLKHQFRYSF